MDVELNFWLGKIAFCKENKELVENFLADTITHYLKMSETSYIEVQRKQPELLIDYRKFKKSWLYPLHETGKRPTPVVKTYPNPDIPKTEASTILEKGSLVLGFIRAYDNGTVYEWLRNYGYVLAPTIADDLNIKSHYEFFNKLLEVYSIRPDSSDKYLSLAADMLQKSGYFLNNENIFNYTGNLRYCPSITPKYPDLVINEWESYDIFALMFIEVVECLKNRLTPRKCTQCNKFMLIRRSDKNICTNCPPPSQNKSATALRVFECRLFEKCHDGKQVDWNMYQKELMLYLEKIKYNNPEKYILDKTNQHKRKLSKRKTSS